MKRSDSSVVLSILMDMPLSGISTRRDETPLDFGLGKLI